jgi:hypothetical protein
MPTQQVGIPFLLGGWLGYYKTTSEQIYERSDWQDRRMRENAWFDWYCGKNLAEAEDTAVDKTTGERAKLYPLQLNPIAKVCRMHRSVLFGMPSDYDAPLVQLAVKPTANKTLAETAQNFLRTVLLASDASSTFQEGGLLTQVYGGHVLQVVWDELDQLSPYRIRVVGIKSPHFYPVYDQRNPWALREAYVGYPVTGEQAQKQYGVNLNGKEEVLYLEHWTPTDYRITVDGIVPDRKGYGKLEGQHKFGRVPLVYIPHYRDGDFFGRSQVEDIIALAIEKNSCSADRGDLVNDFAHPTLVTKNITKSPKMILVETDENGRTVKQAIDLGTEPATPNSPRKELDYLKPPPVPAEVLAYDDELWAEIRRQADVASVAMGDDDVSGGRITGPVTAYRMWPTMSHTQAERIEWATGLRHLADIIFRIARRKTEDGAYKRLNIKGAPEITDEHLALQVGTVWNPQIPIQVSERIFLRKVGGGYIFVHRTLMEYFASLDDTVKAS